jgi:hypothetical protein
VGREGKEKGNEKGKENIFSKDIQCVCRLANMKLLLVVL